MVSIGKWAVFLLFKVSEISTSLGKTLEISTNLGTIKPPFSNNIHATMEV